METVLGLSMTSTSVGWVVLDGRDVDGTPLDHDAFTVQPGTGVAAGSTSQLAEAVRGAQAIATASGHQANSIGVTWSDDVDTEATQLLESLTDLGFDNVVAVRLPEATQAWAKGIGRDLGYAKIAMCVIEPSAVTLLAVDTGDGAVQTAVTRTRDSAEGLSQWLTGLFDRDGSQPESLFLVGSQSDLDAITGGLEAALSIPVFAWGEAQLALARGAALALAKEVDFTDLPAHRPSWLASHSRALTKVAASIVTLVIALFAVGPQATGNGSRLAAYQPPANTSGTAPSAHIVPPPVASLRPVSAPAAPRAQALPAQPPPAPIPTAVPPVSPEVPPPALTLPDDQPASPPTVAAIAAAQAPISPAPAAAPQERVAPAPVPAPQERVAPAPVPAPQERVAPPPEPPPPPPPDPLAQLLSPFFGALP